MSFKFKIILFILLIISFLGYSSILYLSTPPQSNKPDQKAQLGRELWQQKNCTSCHQLYGLGGHLGPDLTNVYGIRSEAYIKAFLESGTSVMPNYNLSPDEMESLIAFLKYTNSTGTSDPRSFKLHIDGTISQP